jgi:hypothetical protein
VYGALAAAVVLGSVALLAWVIVAILTARRWQETLAQLDRIVWLLERDAPADHP